MLYKPFASTAYLHTHAYRYCPLAKARLLVVRFYDLKMHQFQARNVIIIIHYLETTLISVFTWINH